VTDPSISVLRMRLSELADDVAKVQGVLEQLALRGSHLDKLKRLVTPRLGGKTITVPLRGADAQARSLANAVETEAKLAEILESEQIDVARLVEQIGEAQKRLQEMNKIITDMTVVNLNQWRNALSENLEICKNVLEGIEGLCQDIADGAAPAQVWTGLRELHDRNCRALFADYVDLLSGMVLRDTHLDDEICEITYDFLTELGSPRLVLPSRRSELPTMFKDLVKIGFPEWTIWDVPMAAHHAGQWRADQMLPDHPDWSALLPDRTDDVRRCLFADVYATWRTGPAYVCAMLLLHLDPASASVPDRGAVADHERARVISGALTFAELPDEFTAFVKRIGADWSDAVEQNTAPGAARSDTTALDEFAGRVRGMLENRYEPYGAGKWQQANQSLKSVLAGDDEPQQRVELLDLLNAVWALRRAGASPSDLEGRVKSVWWNGGGREGTPPPSIQRTPSARRQEPWTSTA